MTQGSIAREKTCSECKLQKPVSEFYRNRARVSGVEYRCKLCMSRRERRYRTENSELIRARSRQYDRLARKKQNARQMVRRHIAVGKLVKLPCFVCGGDGEAHHPAYSLPLAIVWLCRQHHSQVHSEAKLYERGL